MPKKKFKDMDTIDQCWIAVFVVCAIGGLIMLCVAIYNDYIK